MSEPGDDPRNRTEPVDVAKMQKALEIAKMDIDTLYERCEALRGGYQTLEFTMKCLIGGWSALLFLIVIVSALR
jgi:hypothetical protein